METKNDNEPHDATNSMPTFVINDGKLPEYIESPFKWQPHVFCGHESSEEIVTRLLEKDEEIINDTDFAWRSFIIQLVLCYELRRQNKLTEAKVKIIECEQILKSKEGKCNDIIYRSINKALWHVTMACKASLLLDFELFSEAQNALQTIMLVETMDKLNRAGIFGIKAAVLMEYGFSGSKEAIQYAGQAVKEDSQQAEWHFLLGKSIAVCRRVYSFFDNVEENELKLMKQAVKIATLNSQKPFRYMLYLGNVFRETAFRIFKQNVDDATYKHSNRAEFVLTLNSKARDIYLTLIKHQSENSRLAVRCCFGLLKVPGGIFDWNLIDMTLQKCLAMTPNNMMVLHIIGMFYDRCTEDFEKALHFYRTSAQLGCYGAWNNLIRLSYKIIWDYDPMVEYIKLLDKFKATQRQHQTLSQIAAYYLIQKRDLVKAIEFCMRIANDNKNSYQLKMMKPNFINTLNPINLIQVLTQEVQYELKTKLNELDSNTKKILRKFIMQIVLIDSELIVKEEILEASPVENIIQKSKELEIIKTDKKYSKKKLRFKKLNEKRKMFKDIKTQDTKTHDKRQRNNKKYAKLKKKEILKRKEEERERIELIKTGLPKEIALRIKELKLEKGKRTKHRSLSESRKDELVISSNESSYKFFEEKFRKKMLYRNASVDSLPLLYKNQEQKKVYHSNSSLDYCSDDSSVSTNSKDKELSKSLSTWRTTVDEDRDFKNKTVNKITSEASSQDLSWRTNRGENRAFGETNIISGSKIKRTNSNNSLDSDGDKSWSRSSGKQNMNKGMWSKWRTNSKSSFEDEFEPLEKKSGKEGCEVWNNSQFFQKKGGVEDNPRNYTRVRSYSTSTNRVDLFKSLETPLHEIIDVDKEKRNCRKNEEQFEKNFVENHVKNSRFRSYSMGANTGRNFFEPNFKSSPFDRKNFSLEQNQIDLRQKRNNDKDNMESKSTKVGSLGKSKISTETNSDKIVSGNGSQMRNRPMSQSTWRSARRMSENNIENKQKSSSKANMNGVIRQPYGPEDGKKGFTLVRKL